MSAAGRPGPGAAEGGDGEADRDGAGAEDGHGADRAATVERVVTVASLGVTLALVGVVVWQSVTTPAGVRPEVRVVGVEPTPDGSVDVTVELVNAGSVGLATVAVEVDCATPPPELAFEHVPASGRRRGTVVCPPGTTDPNATVAVWRET